MIFRPFLTSKFPNYSPASFLVPEGLLRLREDQQLLNRKTLKELQGIAINTKRSFPIESDGIELQSILNLRSGQGSFWLSIVKTIDIKSSVVQRLTDTTSASK